ncbi:MAG: carboxypeptidase regulatory-like domain-containing protein, partial [Leptolyngbya sp. SIO4C1]|nr:carboxypeptidase regulatory-like domain-containing protein [Leptolyngbya sp. SIO4C1]
MPHASLAAEPQNLEGVKYSFLPGPELSVFVAGVIVNDREILTSALIRGQGSDYQEQQLDRWKVPYEIVVEVLNLETEVLDNGNLRLSSPGLMTEIDLDELETDPELGLVFSVQELRSQFQLEVEFDLEFYALRLTVPWLDAFNQVNQESEIYTSGLSQVSPAPFSVAATEQQLRYSSGANSDVLRSEFSAVGSLLGGSWFMQVEQPTAFSLSDTRLSDLQLRWQSDPADYILGSQPSFWPTEQSGDYWGFTTIQRSGFTPQQQLYGLPDPRRRLYAEETNRTVVGEANPGDRVRLVLGFSGPPIAEAIVDASGVYRFESVPIQTRLGNGSYNILVYPNGDLGAQPDIQTATFSALPGQLPEGASAFVFSAGARRQTTANSLVGEFSGFEVSLSQRWGLSESLTLGAGALYDDAMRGLLDIYYQPQNFPLRAAISTIADLDGSDWDVNADVLFQPSDSFSAQLISDRFSTRLSTNWQLSPELSLLGSWNSKTEPRLGVQFASAGQTTSTFARLSVDTDLNLYWNLSQRLDQFSLRSNGNDVSTQSKLTYYLNPDGLNQGHSFSVKYDTQDRLEAGLTSLLWSYRAPERTVDNRPLWE